MFVVGLRTEVCCLGVVRVLWSMGVEEVEAAAGVIDSSPKVEGNKELLYLVRYFDGG